MSSLPVVSAEQNPSFSAGLSKTPVRKGYSGSSLSPPSEFNDNNLSPSLSSPKLPFGAIVSPLSPFFSERAKQFTLEKARAKALGEALSSAKKLTSRPRSTSQGSFDSDANSSTSSADTSSSSQSVATAIGSIDDANLPTTMPKISYSEWSKFGISLFIPKLANPHSQLSYHYPSNSGRPRSASAVTKRSPWDSRVATPLEGTPNHLKVEQRHVRPPLRSSTWGAHYSTY